MKRTLRGLGVTAFSVGLIVFAGAADAQTASGSSGAAPSLAQFAPQNDAMIYIEFDGLAAHDKAWHDSAASKILSDTKTGAMFEDILTQIFEQLLANVPDRSLTGADISALIKHALNNGFVFVVNGKPGSNPAATVVIRSVMTAENKPVVARFLRTAKLVHPQAAITDKPGGRRVANPGQGMPNWWLERNSDLVITSPDQADKVIAALDGKAPNMSTHPRRDKLSKGQEGFEPVGWGFAEIAAFGPLPPDAAKFGLDGVKSVQVQWGLDGPAMRSVIDVEAPAPRKGALALLDQPTFESSNIPALPDKVDSFAVLSFDFNQSMMKLSTMLDQAGMPEVKRQIADMEEGFHTATKLDLRKDVLAHLGPQITAYTLPTKGGIEGALNTLNPLAFLGQIPRMVIKIEIRDQVAVTKSLTQLMSFANKQLATAIPTPDASAGATNSPTAGVPGRAGGTAKAKTSKPTPAMEFKMVKPKPLTYQLSLSPQLAMLFNHKVTISLSAKNLIVATEPGLASDAVALDEKASEAWSPSGDFATAVKNMPKSLVFFAVSDTRDTTPKALAELPATLQRALAALSPPQQAASAGGFAPPSAPGANAGVNVAEEPGVGGRRGGRPGRGPVGAPPPGGGEAGQAPGGRGPVGAPPPGGGTPAVPGTPPGGGSAIPGAPPGGGAAPGAVPGMPKLTINVSPANIPTPESVRSLLFPSATAISVDSQGVHIVSRDAFFDVQSLTAGLNSMIMNQAKTTAGMSPMAGNLNGQAPPGGLPGAAAAGPGAAAAGGGSPAASRPD